VRQVARLEDAVDDAAGARDPVDVPLHQERDETGGAPIVEAAPGRGLEEPDLPVPEEPRVVRQARAQGAVDLARAGRAAPAEEREEVAERERPDAGPLQLEQVVLPGIRIHRDDARARERVVEGVAARAGDDHHPVGGPEAEGLAVDGGIFPALVVHEAVAPEQAEEPPVDEPAGTTEPHEWKPPASCSTTGV